MQPLVAESGLLGQGVPKSLHLNSRGAGGYITLVQQTPHSLGRGSIAQGNTISIK